MFYKNFKEIKRALSKDYCLYGIENINFENAISIDSYDFNYEPLELYYSDQNLSFGILNELNKKYILDGKFFTQDTNYEPAFLKTKFFNNLTVTFINNQIKISDFDSNKTVFSCYLYDINSLKSKSKKSNEDISSDHFLESYGSFKYLKTNGIDKSRTLTSGDILVLSGKNTMYKDITVKIALNQDKQINNIEIEYEVEGINYRYSLYDIIDNQSLIHLFV